MRTRRSPAVSRNVCWRSTRVLHQKWCIKKLCARCGSEFWETNSGCRVYEESFSGEVPRDIITDLSNGMVVRLGHSPSLRMTIHVLVALAQDDSSCLMFP